MQLLCKTGLVACQSGRQHVGAHPRQGQHTRMRFKREGFLAGRSRRRARKQHNGPRLLFCSGAGDAAGRAAAAGGAAGGRRGDPAGGVAPRDDALSGGPGCHARPAGLHLCLRPRRRRGRHPRRHVRATAPRFSYPASRVAATGLCTASAECLQHRASSGASGDARSAFLGAEQQRTAEALPRAATDAASVSSSTRLDADPASCMSGVASKTSCARARACPRKFQEAQAKEMSGL